MHGSCGVVSTEHNEGFDIEEGLSRMKDCVRSGDSEAFLEVVRAFTNDRGLHGLLSELSARSAMERTECIFYLLVWLRVRRLDFTLFNAEMVEKFLEIASSDVEKVVSEMYLVETLKEIKMYVSENILGYNRTSVSSFLFRVFLSSSNAVRSSKVFSFQLYMQINKPMQKEHVQNVLYEFDAMDEFVVDGVKFRDKVVMSVYEAFLFQDLRFDEQNHDYVVSLLFERYFSSDVDSALLTLFSYPSVCSGLICVSFVLFFFREIRRSRDLDIKPLGTALKRLVSSVRQNEYTHEEALYFSVLFGSDRPRMVVTKLYRSIVLFLLQIVDKKGQNRIKAAKILCRADLSISLGRKMNIRVSKMIKKHLRSTSVITVDCSINVLGHIAPELLLTEMQRPYPIDVRRKMFDRVKDKFQCEKIYRTYMDLLSNDETRGVEYEVRDVETFARVFYYYDKKCVCEFMDIEVESIKDTFVADLVVYYSSFHSEMDEVYVASILLEGGEEIAKSKNIPFYCRIMKILVNLRQKITPALRKRLALLLRRLVFYSPYTRDAGMLVNALGYEEMEIPRKTDYFITIIGACGSPWFREFLGGYPWTFNKERGLVYNLRFDPALGTVYKWKLEEILRRANGGIGEKGIIVYVELMEVLREFVVCKDLCSATAFFFELVAKSHDLLVSGAKNDIPSVSKKSCELLLAATRVGAILSHVSMPVILSYSVISVGDIKMHSEVIVNSLHTILENKMTVYKEQGNIPELKMIYDIYTSLPDRSRLVEKIPTLFDDCPVRAYYILVQVIRFNRKDSSKIMDAIGGMMHSYDRVENRVVLRIFGLFLELCGDGRMNPRRRVKVSKEEILFDRGSSCEDIESLELLHA